MAASQAELLKAQPLNLITTLRKFWGFGFGFGFEVLLLTLTLKPLAKRRKGTRRALCRAAFSLDSFFWRSKRKKLARRGETRHARQVR